MSDSLIKISKKLFRAKVIRRHKNRVFNKECAFIFSKFKFSGSNNIIESNNSVFYKCKFLISGSNNKIVVGSGCKLKFVTFCIEGDNNLIKIGDNCALCGRSELSCLEGTNIIIGNWLLSSSDVYLRTSDSHTVYDLSGNRINSAKDIIIGDNVWLCQKSSLLKGSKIPNNCIVAYGSIVTKPFDKDNCIIGGNPAKIIKEHIKWGGEGV